MSDADFNIKAIISAQTSQFENGIKNVQKEINKTSSNLSKFTTGLKKAFVKGGAIGIGIATVTTAVKSLSNTLKQSVKIWEQANSEQKKLTQTLKVTGAETWATTEDLNAMADAYQRATNFSSDDITKMQTVLLGFKNVTKDTFESASNAILDMAEVMGMDLVSATQTVGKALDDPISGLGSLSRQGFKFSETQKELIKNLVDAGESAKAQKIILDELNTTYGEASKKGAKASIQIKNSWNSILQEMGRNIVLSVDTEPAQKKLNKMLEDWKKALKESADATQYSDDLIKAQNAVNEGVATYEQNLMLVEDEIKKIGLLRLTYEEAYNNALKNNWESDIEYNKEHMDSLDYELKMLNARKKIIEEVIASERQEVENQEKAKKEADERQAIEDSINALKLKYQKIILEQEKQWELQKKVTGESVNLEEKRNFYQQKLIEIVNEAGGKITENNQYYKDQMEIIKGITDQMSKEPEMSTNWLDKLKEQRIEMLEDERDKVIGFAEDEGEDTYSIWREYNEKIYELKLQRLEEEKENALSEEKLTEEEKEAIIEYYNNEVKKIYDDLMIYKRKKNKKEEEEEESKFSKMLRATKQFAIKVTEIFKKVSENIKKVFDSIVTFSKNVFDGLKNIFSKLFEFNTDDALNSLLAVEDAILTFFVETLPKLPSFFESAFSSVLILIQTLIKSIDWDSVKNIIDSIIKTFVTYAPQIVSGIVELFTNLVTSISDVLVDNASDIVSAVGEMFFTVLEALPGLISNFLKVAGTYISEIGKYFADNAEKLSDDLTAIIKSIVDGISDFISGGGWKNLLDGLLAIQNAIQNAVLDNLDSIVDVIIDALPDLIQTLIDSIVSASKAMEKILKPLIKLVLALVEAIIDLLLSDEVLDAGIEAGFAIMDAIFEELVPRLAYLIPKLITKIIAFIVKNIPKIVVAMVKGLVKSFVSFPWVQSIKEMFQGFIDGIKDFFGIHSPSTLFESFGEFMIEGLWEGIANLGQWLWDNVVGFFSNLWEGITNVFSNVGEWFSDTFSTAKEGMTSVFENVGNWAVDVWENIKDGFSTVGEWFSDVFKGARAGISSAFDKVGDWASDRWEDIKSGFSNAGEWFKSVFSTAWTNAKAGFSKVGDWASGVWTNIKSGFSNVGDWFKTTFTTGWTKAKEGFTNVKNWASEVWTNVKSGFSGVGDWFKSTFSTAWTNIKNAWSGVGNWFKGIADGIKSNFSNCVDNMKGAFSKAGDWVKSMASKIGSGLSKAGEAIKDGASWVGNKIKDFFGFATGTQQAPSGLALVGEAGPELVRFRGGEQVLNARNTQKALEGMGNGRTNNFNVTFNNLQDTSAFAMMNQLKQYNRQMAINGIF